MHRIFKKHRRYFPIPLGIRESFRETAARRKRVKQVITPWTLPEACSAFDKCLPKFDRNFLVPRYILGKIFIKIKSAVIVRSGAPLLVLGGGLHSSDDFQNVMGTSFHEELIRSYCIINSFRAKRFIIITTSRAPSLLGVATTKARFLGIWGSVCG